MRDQRSENLGPVYGVELIDALPIRPTNQGVLMINCGMLQAMPNSADLKRAHMGDHTRLANGYEVLLIHYHDLRQRLSEGDDGG